MDLSYKRLDLQVYTIPILSALQTARPADNGAYVNLHMLTRYRIECGMTLKERSADLKQGKAENKRKNKAGFS